MGWFSRKIVIPCDHNWVVTEALHITLRDPVIYVVPEVKRTNVSRVCKYCLKKEFHTVNGHIDSGMAFDIYGGQE